MRTASTIFIDADKASVEAAIRAAELLTSGEIKVYVENRCGSDPAKRAVEVFAQLGMKATELQNGVLIYLAVLDRKFVILGDKGVDARTPPGFWDDIRDEMRRHFKDDRFVEGIVYAVHEAGAQLRTYFPRADDDVNELADEIIVHEN